MIRDDRQLGQLDPATISAAVPEPPGGPGLSGFGYFKLAVAAGITVWIVTRLLDGVWEKEKAPRLGRLASHPSDHPEGE